MKIGVVSDTHLYNKNARLPQALWQGLLDVDLILHAGDWISLHVAEELEAIAPLDGVAGNNDGFDIVDRFGKQKLLQVGGLTVGIIHGDGYGRSTEQRAWEAFFAQSPDIIIFGHSHVPYKEQRGKTLLFNPGSPTDKRRQPRYSYGIIDIAPDHTFEATHIFFESKL